VNPNRSMVSASMDLIRKVRWPRRSSLTSTIPTASIFAIMARCHIWPVNCSSTQVSCLHQSCRPRFYLKRGKLRPLQHRPCPMWHPCGRNV